MDESICSICKQKKEKIFNIEIKEKDSINSLFSNIVCQECLEEFKNIQDNILEKTQINEMKKYFDIRSDYTKYEGYISLKKIFSIFNIKESQYDKIFEEIKSLEFGIDDFYCDDKGFYWDNDNDETHPTVMIYSSLYPLSERLYQIYEIVKKNKKIGDNKNEKRI